MNKQIENVVFYKFYGEQGVMQQACIFYTDGTVKNTSHEEGIDAAHELAVSKKIKTKEQFRREMLNKENIYTLTGEEFERRFQEFRGKGLTLSRRQVTGTALIPRQTVELAPVNQIRPTRVPAEHTEQVSSTEQPVVTPINRVSNPEQPKEPVAPVAENNGVVPPIIVPPVGAPINRASNPEQPEEPVAENNGVVPPIIVPPVGAPINRTSSPEQPEQPVAPVAENNGVVPPIIVPPVGAPINRTGSPEQPQQSVTTVAANNGAVPTQPQQPAAPTASNNGVVPPVVVPPVGATPVVEPVSPTPTVTPVAAQQETTDASENTQQPKKKKGLFSRMWAKVTAIALACVLALTGAFALGKTAKDGKLFNRNADTAYQIDNGIQEQDAAYLALLEKSTNEDQKESMTYMSEKLDMFNRDFASNYVEQGKNVRAALTWDEMMALNLAYNTYTKDQIAIMFNGSEVNAEAMSQAYRNANLQLMGAYVIADRDHPVNSAAFVNNEYEREFVEKYEDLFLKCKEATGESRVAAINAFYAELYKDFPISDEVREIGISHADGRQQLEPYKTAVTPMVAAMEIMWQNTNGVDHTLSDKAIDYFNDLGLCNLIDSKFERAQAITLAATTDTTQPLYEEFRNAKIQELIYEGNYPTTDANRDLSQLDAFQYWVNGHHDVKGTGSVKAPSGKPKTTTKTVVTPGRTETTTRTETTVEETPDREEAVEAVGEEAVKKAEEAVDRQIEAENQAAKEQAEREAEIRRQQLQQQADAETRRLEELIRQDEANLQQSINTANKIIENGGTVNEKDLGHGVDFDDDHSNENGDLDSSVKDITTDGTGAVDADAPLPDPNKTGAAFDAQAGSYSAAPEASSYTAPQADSYTAPQQPTTQVPSGSEQIPTPTGMEGTVYEFDPSMLEGYTLDQSSSDGTGFRFVPSDQASQILDYEESYTPSNEELVDAYLAELENGQSEAGYQYSK